MNQKWNLQDIQPARPRKTAKHVRPVSEEPSENHVEEPVSDIKIKKEATSNVEHNALRE